MKCSRTKFDGVLVIEPKVIEDNRGYFMECYVSSKFEEFGVTVRFVQDNHSVSTAPGTIRGMHFQLDPAAQAKLIRVVRGEIMNVVVDIRKGSPAFGRWTSVNLSAANRKQLFVPRGFANGYCTLTPEVEIVYKVDEYYSPDLDRAFMWNDPDVGIDWPVSDPVLSEKDRTAPPLKEVDNNYRFEEK